MASSMPGTELITSERRDLVPSSLSVSKKPFPMD